MKGFTLIELIVVLVILFTAVGVAVMNIVRFQKNSVLGNASQELASTLRTAQTNSSNGVLKPGETYATFDPDGLPYYGVKFNSGTYDLVRKYTLSGSGTESEDILETHTYDGSITVAFSPSSPTTIMFSRTSGLPFSAVTVTLTQQSAGTKQILVNAAGLIRL